MKYYFKAFGKYGIMDGRTSRKEFLWFSVINYVIISFLYVMAILFDLSSVWLRVFAFACVVYILAAACPTICIEVRRLHDIGKSGLWWWARNVPILNIYYAYLIILKPSQPFTNEYGASPIPIHKKSSKSTHTSGQNKRKKK